MSEVETQRIATLVAELTEEYRRDSFVRTAVVHWESSRAQQKGVRWLGSTIMLGLLRYSGLESIDERTARLFAQLEAGDSRGNIAANAGWLALDTALFVVNFIPAGGLVRAGRTGTQATVAGRTAGQQAAREYANLVSKKFADDLARLGTVTQDDIVRMMDGMARHLSKVGAEKGILAMRIIENATWRQCSAAFRPSLWSALRRADFAEAFGALSAILVGPPAVIPETARAAALYIRNTGLGTARTVAHEVTHVIHVTMTRGIYDGFARGMRMSIDDVERAIVRFESNPQNYRAFEEIATHLGSMAQSNPARFAAEFGTKMDEMATALYRAICESKGLTFPGPTLVQRLMVDTAVNMHRVFGMQALWIMAGLGWRDPRAEAAAPAPRPTAGVAP